MAAVVDAHTTAWLNAIRRTNHAAARLHLRSDQDVNVRGDGGITALHIAAGAGQRGKTRSLLHERADVTATDDEGRTPLMVAQCNMMTGVVRDLIDHEQLVRALTIHLERTPTLNEIHIAKFQRKWRAFRDQVQKRQQDASVELINAARVGDLRTVRRVVESGVVHVDSLHETTEETAFSVALAGGWFFVCEYLLANGAHAYSPCLVAGKAQSSLLSAVRHGDVSFVRRLLKHRVHLSCPRLDLKTCVMMEAVAHGTNEMIDVLLEAGAQIKWIYEQHSLAKCLYYAMSAGHLAEENKIVWQRLNFACWRQDLCRVQQLFETCTVLQDQQAMATKGSSALYLAAYQQNEEIVTELLARGAKINSTVPLGETAIVAGVRVNSLRMVHFLLERGAHVSVVHDSLRDGTGFAESTLSTAVYFGAMDCARLLLPMETRPEQLDQALMLAVYREDQEFVQTLLDKALPSTENAFALSVSKTRSPVILDLLLTRCCAERYSINTVVHIFQWFCRDAEAELLAVFVVHGIDVNAQDQWGSALVHAVKTDHGCKPEVIKLLIDSGATTNSEDGNGRTALALVEQILQSRMLVHDARTRFEACRDILRGESSRSVCKAI